MTPIDSVRAALQAGYHHHVVVVTGAAPLDAEIVAELGSGALVLAADGGLDHALAAGLHPAGLVGDLDSVSADGLAWATAHATISRHDPAKDHTDTELALDMAVQLNPARLTMLAGGGDRLDHTLAALGALTRPNMTSVPWLEAWWGTQRIRVVHGPGRAAFVGLPLGSTVSLLALGGSAHGVTSSGVRWPLAGSDVAALSGYGVSNEVTDSTVDVAVSSGVLAVFTNP